jgi:hypothetical protein
MLTTKKSPNDILKLFNQQPQTTLFAGSPAQVSLLCHFANVGCSVILPMWAAPHMMVLRAILQTK